MKEIQVHLHDEMKRIIADYGNESGKPDDYVFRILRPNTDALRQHSDRMRYKRLANVSLTSIGKKLGFPVLLTLNIARHSFATMLKISGTPISFISEAMGHTNTVTTEHYLKSIPEENMKNLSGHLLAFT